MTLEPSGTPAGSRVACVCRCCVPVPQCEELTIGGHRRPRCDRCGRAFEKDEQAFHYWTKLSVRPFLMALATAAMAGARAEEPSPVRIQKDLPADPPRGSVVDWYRQREYEKKYAGLHRRRARLRGRA